MIATSPYMRVAPQECVSRPEVLESRVLGKRASPVRREAVGKGPLLRDLAGGPPNVNLREALERLLTRKHVAVRAAAEGLVTALAEAPVSPTIQAEVTDPIRLTGERLTRLQTRAARPTGPAAGAIRGGTCSA